MIRRFPGFSLMSHCVRRVGLRIYSTLFAGMARLLVPGVAAALVMALVTHAGAVTAPFGPVEAGPTLTARTLADRIRQDGAQKTAEALTRDHEWPRVRRAVAAGWQNWIATMPDLLPQADQRTAQGLQRALRQALPRSPGAVLAALDPKNGPLLGGQTICRPDGMPATWRARTTRAVRAVHDIHLINQGGDCLRALHAAPQG